MRLFKEGFVFLHEAVDFVLHEIGIRTWRSLVDVFCCLSKVFVPVSLHNFESAEFAYFSVCLSF